MECVFGLNGVEIFLGKSFELILKEENNFQYYLRKFDYNYKLFFLIFFKNKLNNTPPRPDLTFTRLNLAPPQSSHPDLAFGLVATLVVVAINLK